MAQENDSLRERLLARLPQPGNFAGYRNEVISGLAKQERRLRWSRWGSALLWAYVVAFFVYSLNRGEGWLSTPKGHLWEFISITLFVVGAVELMKYFIHRSRLQILTEVKQVQLQVLELQASLKNGGRPQE